jgi:PTH2 family peptidyl-tRNA hydrolase
VHRSVRNVPVSDILTRRSSYLTKGTMLSHALSRPVSSAVERYLDTVEVAGSNPARVTLRLLARFLLLENLEAAMSDVKQVIVVRKDLNMRKGKIAAQVAHASMKFLVDNNEAERGDEVIIKLTPAEAMWLTGSFTKVVVGVDSEEALQNLIFQAEMSDVEVHPIIDAGRTEFNGVPTLTCAAFGPCTAEELDKITGNLKLI